MFWHWSLLDACFALISSVQQRFLAELPDKRDEFDEWKPHLLATLNLALGVNHSDKTWSSPRPVSCAMIWVWQTPMMLMNYSWVLFLLGYAIHILTPIFDGKHDALTQTVRVY